MPTHLLRGGLRLVGAAAALGVLGACGPSGADGPSADPTFSPDAVVGVQALHSLFPASSAQFNDGVRYTRLRQALQATALARCMTEAGFTPDPASGYDVLMTVNTVDFPDLDRIAATKAFVPPISVDFPGKAEDPLRTAARDRCRPVAGALFKVPGTSTDLADRWWTGMRTIQASSQVRATLPGFRACMVEAGAPAEQIPVTSSLDAFGKFLAWEDGMNTHAASPAAITENNERWAPVFAECARPVMAVLEPLALESQKVFLRRNGKRIEQLVARSDAEVKAAQRTYGTQAPLSG
ncbi:hypothetical protein ACFZBU_35550 [Embleya sp. NPDC008237]|uniref:hypothetical protein n=1 Tax=Embleya sp. NPDC008237 TaxID=3363978 RepID=UPI0036EA6C9A